MPQRPPSYRIASRLTRKGVCSLLNLRAIGFIGWISLTEPLRPLPATETTASTAAAFRHVGPLWELPG